MKFVIDMNVSPAWTSVFETHGYESVHWSYIGSSTATDSEILVWAYTNDYIVFTNDLDFGAIIASTRSRRPSVIQLRDLDVTPTDKSEVVMHCIKRHRQSLTMGAIMSIDARGSRVHLLPIREGIDK